MELIPESRQEQEKDLLWFFDLALWVKVVNGALEMFVALLLLFVPPSLVVRLAEFATNGEISQDSTDLIANTIRDMAQTFAVHTHYLFALYLALHGAAKVVLVIGIFKKKRLAYPLFMIALVLFGGYEAYRGFILRETLLQVLSVFDLSLLLLTAHEYRRRYQVKHVLRDMLESFSDLLKKAR